LWEPSRSLRWIVADPCSGKHGLFRKEETPSGASFRPRPTQRDGDFDGLADRLSLTLNAPSTGSAAAIQSGGVVTASAFGGFRNAAPGPWIEIYGSGPATDTRSWATADFSGSNAPTSLNGTSVTIGGQRAFVSYLSPGQVNVRVPSNLGSGTQNVVVSTPNGDTASVPPTLAPNDPGLLAPATFQINRRQYVVALHLDGTYVLPPGVIAGEPIFLYGLGLGTVTPNMPAGQIVVAPNVSDNDALPFSFTLGGTAGTQTAVKRVLAGWAPGVEGGEQSAAEWTARIRVARDPPRVNATRK
jgi:uncharacterized protein (TIGR03437 family)